MASSGIVVMCWVLITICAIMIGRNLYVGSNSTSITIIGIILTLLCICLLHFMGVFIVFIGVIVVILFIINALN